MVRGIKATCMSGVWDKIKIQRTYSKYCGEGFGCDVRIYECTKQV